MCKAMWIPFLRVIFRSCPTACESANEHGFSPWWGSLGWRPAMRRHELSDGQWELIADLMPRAGRHGGGRWQGHRQVVKGPVWRLCTELKLNAEGLSDLDLWCIDSTSVRASRSAAGTRKKGIHRSPTTIRSTSRVAASAPRSTCGAMVRACRSALRSRSGRGTRCWCSNRLRR
jgi:transposase